MDVNANVHSSISTKAENAYINSTIIKDTLAAKTASVNSLLNNLKVGDLFQGQIVDIRNNFVSILLADSNTITAKLPEKMNLNINQDIIFKVKDNTNNQITIQPYMMDELPEEAIMKALSNANLKPSEANINAVKDLVGHRLPIDKNTLANYVDEVSIYGKEHKEEILTLHKFNITISEENIEQIKKYLANEHKLATEITKLTNNVIENFRQKDSINIKDIMSLVGDNVSLENSEKLSAIIKHEVGSDNIFIQNNTSLTDKNIMSTNVVFNELNEDLPVITLDITKDIATNLSTDLPTSVTKEIETNLSSIISTDLSKELSIDLDKEISFAKYPEFKNIIKDSIEKALMVDVKSLSNNTSGDKLKEIIEDIYENIDKKLDDIKKVFDKENSEMADVIREQTNNIKNNVSFMKELNYSSEYNYIQIPIKNYNEYSNGELYVYNRKNEKNSYDLKDKLTAFLHFDLTYLGACDISVVLQDKTLSASFTIADVKSASLVEKHLDELTQALNKQGFVSNCRVEKISNENKDIIDKIIDDNNAAKDIKRYSFDVRA